MNNSDINGAFYMKIDQAHNDKQTFIRVTLINKCIISRYIPKNRLYRRFVSYKKKKIPKFSSILNTKKNRSKFLKMNVLVNESKHSKRDFKR